LAALRLFVFVHVEVGLQAMKLAESVGCQFLHQKEFCVRVLLNGIAQKIIPVDYMFITNS
jgi:hypothetical protein